MFIKKHLKTNYFDFLISACYWSNQLLPFFVRKGKIIACDHGDFNSLTLLDRTMARCCYRFSDAVVLLHEKHAENYTFIPDNKKFVIPNPIPFQTEKKADCVNKKMLFLARLSCEKGADLLLDIAEKLKEKIPEWQIDIYGDGPEEYKLKQLAESKNLSGFLFFHPATNNVLEKYLESSIYLMTSRHEGLPMVLLEAQTCGLPTVAYDCNIGPRCVITHGENGYLIPPGEKELFAEHVVKLASDLKHRQQLGKNAIKNSEKFLPEVIVAKWINLFQELLSRQEKK